MGIVPESGQARVVHRGQATAGHHGPVQAQNPQSAAREVGLQHEGVVARAENDAVVSPHSSSSLRSRQIISPGRTVRPAPAHARLQGLRYS